MSGFCDYIVYADESGDHGIASIDAHYPIFVLTFALVAKRDYISDIVPRFQALKFTFFGHDQLVLHERDIRKQLGAFGVFRVDAAKRTAFLDAINETVAGSSVELYSAVIRKSDLLARYAAPKNPYEIALLFCMERVMLRLLQLGQAGRHVHVVFESRGAEEDKSLLTEFGRIVRNETWGYRQLDFRAFEWTALMAPKASNSSGLQLADLASRPIGLHTLKPNQPNRAFEILAPKIRAMTVFP